MIQVIRYKTMPEKKKKGTIVLEIPLVLRKEAERDQTGAAVIDNEGKPKMKCGFRIGGGIDQDNTKSPQGYPDKGIYVTHVTPNGPAEVCGLQIHDKLLQVNGHDLTVVVHKKAVEYIQRKPILNMLIYRQGVPSLQKGGTPQPQFQAYTQEYQPPYQRQY